MCLLMRHYHARCVCKAGLIGHLETKWNNRDIAQCVASYCDLAGARRHSGNDDRQRWSIYSLFLLFDLICFSAAWQVSFSAGSMKITRICKCPRSLCDPWIAIKPLPPLRDWRAARPPQIGWWVHAGRGHTLDRCLCDYVPINMAERPLPECPRDRYWAINLPGTRFKENIHKQLWMNLNGWPSPPRREIHHSKSNRWDNAVATLSSSLWRNTGRSTGEGADKKGLTVLSE